MRRSLRVLHVETGRHLYGGPLQVFYLLDGLSKDPDVHSILVCPEGSAISQAAGACVASLHAVPMKGDLDVTFVQRLVHIVRKERPDLIHLHSRRGADILGGIAGKLTGTPCLLTRRVDNPEKRLWVRLKYRLYQRIITISEGIRGVLLQEGVPPDKITCVPSAVDADLYDRPCDRSWFREEFQIEEGYRVCGTVAQFIARKGHKDLLDAFPSILREAPQTKIILFGKGPLEQKLRAMCRHNSIEDSVIFAGFRPDLDRILPCLDLIVHPAYMEGLGVSLLQAAAAGIPIVATRVGGIPEIVSDGVNGRLIQPGDRKALAACVVELLGNRDLALTWGEAGKKIVRDRFSIEAMVNGNLAEYGKMINREPGAGS